MTSHADLLYCEPVRRLERKNSLTELFGPFNLLAYTVIRTQAHPVYGLSSLLAVTPIDDEVKKRLKYKFITVSDDGRIQKIFDESLIRGLSIAPCVDDAIREMDDAVDENFSKMQRKIAKEITPAKGSIKPKKPLTDEELVRLFGNEENQEKKKNDKKKGSKKRSKKKPNSGKTENGIRKTQKPVRL